MKRTNRTNGSLVSKNSQSRASKIMTYVVQNDSIARISASVSFGVDANQMNRNPVLIRGTLRARKIGRDSRARACPQTPQSADRAERGSLAAIAERNLAIRSGSIPATDRLLFSSRSSATRMRVKTLYDSDALIRS